MADLLKSVIPSKQIAPQAFKIGVLSDTHVPDRHRQFDPRLRTAFQKAEVDLIFHAGDISTQTVLDQLQEIAPVRAVRGNRDWMMLRNLPPVLQMEINGVSLALTHGHGNLMNYITDRLNYYRYGFQIEGYLSRLQSAFPASQIIIFGHIHRPFNRMIAGKLYFNPGSAHVPDPPYTPSAGIIEISSLGQVQARVVQLNGIPLN